MQKLIAALKELKTQIRNEGHGIELHAMIDSALNSGDPARMRAALDRFDKTSTLAIQKLRLGADGEISPRPPA